MTRARVAEAMIEDALREDLELKRFMFQLAMLAAVAACGLIWVAMIPIGRKHWGRGVAR